MPNLNLLKYNGISQEGLEPEGPNSQKNGETLIVNMNPPGPAFFFCQKI
jgi:hypothetical protein